MSSPSAKGAQGSISQQFGYLGDQKTSVDLRGHGIFRIGATMKPTGSKFVFINGLTNTQIADRFREHEYFIGKVLKILN